MSNVVSVSNEGDNYIKAFLKALKDSATSLRDTGRLLVKIVDEVPRGIERLMEQAPGLSQHTIRSLLAIGRGQVHEGLMIADGPAVSKLKRCDIALQSKYLNEAVPVLIKEDGKTTHLMVSIWDMTKEQVEQVFGNGIVRTLEQQRQWLESRRPRLQNIAMEKPYTVRKGRVIIHRAETELTVEQMAMLIAEASA